MSHCSLHFLFCLILFTLYFLILKVPISYPYFLVLFYFNPFNPLFPTIFTFIYLILAFFLFEQSTFSHLKILLLPYDFNNELYSFILKSLIYSLSEESVLLPKLFPSFFSYRIIGLSPFC
jgi:hypothetical protein